MLVQVVAVGGTPPKSRYCDLINYALSSNFDPDKIEGFGINVMDTHELRVVRMRELWLGKNYPALLALLKQDEGEVMLGISYYHYLGSSLLILGMREQGEECLGEALQIEPRATVLRKYLAESRGTAFVTPQSPPLREYALSLLRHMQR